MHSRLSKAILSALLLLSLCFLFSHSVLAESSQFRFDFGPGPVEEGYIGVSCKDYYNPATGYGWSEESVMDGRDRTQALGLLERDFCFANAYRFLVDLPNGLYAIHLLSGDQIAVQAPITVVAEGETKLSGVGAPAGSYVDEVFTVYVQDGQLELAISGNTARLNALQIVPLQAYDFGPGAPEAGYTAVSCDTPYSTETGYGWREPDFPLGSVQTDDALKGDSCHGPSFAFLVDLPNGTYVVSILSGDAEADHTLTVTAEGVTIADRLQAPAGTYLDVTEEVRVTDGQLTLEFEGDPARINALTLYPVMGYEPPAWPVTEGILVEDQGSTVTLTNSEISITLNKSNPTITVLRKKGKYEQVNLLNSGRGYYLLNYYFNGQSREYGGSNMSYRLISQTDERVEISLSVDNPSVVPFKIDYRFVLEADSSGFYVYSIFDYHEGMPDGLEIEQSRYSFRGNPDLFTHYIIEDRSMGDRVGTFPKPQDISNGRTLMDATYRLPNGEIYTKYQHAVFIGDNDANGIFGEDIGLSIIRPSTEYLVGGPAKQEYFVEMTNTTPMVHWYEQVRHYGTPRIVPDQGWSKVYGPFFVYVNEADNLEELWNDVKRQTEAEKAKWPYAWLDHPLYDADNRGTVTGRLVLADGSPAANAWVILGQPGENFYVQTLDYLYYAQADEQGRFTIEHARPGTYTLYAYTDGVFGQFTLDGIEVTANNVLDLQEVTWTPKTNGETLWQIGIPDRTPREFKYGDQLRQWGLWLQYPLDFPNDVNFVIGESDESTDWNYMHPAIKTPGEPDHLLVPRDTTPAEWTIRFQADAMPGTATLTIAIAGSSRGSLVVTLNGTTLAQFNQVIPIGNDASVYRAGEAGYYNVLEIPFDAALLQDGENILALKHLGYSGSTDAIMYDALRLEVDPATIEALQRKVDEYGNSGDLQNPLLAILQNQLNQAQHHLQNGRVNQAVHFLE